MNAGRDVGILFGFGVDDVANQLTPHETANNSRLAKHETTEQWPGFLVFDADIDGF